MQVDTSGRGELGFSNGRRYLGDYRDGVPDGQGVMTFADGERDEGQWSDNKRVGRGVITWPDGARYEGRMERFWEARPGRPDVAKWTALRRTMEQ